MSELSFNRILLEKTIQVLSLIIAGLFVLLLGVGVILILSVNKPQQVVYADSGIVTSVQADDYSINEVILTGFTRWIAKEYLSFSPATLSTQLEGIQQYLTAGLIKSALNTYQKNKLTIQEGAVVDFTISQVEIRRNKNPYQLAVIGTLMILDKKGHFKNDVKTYVFDIQKFRPTKENPYGLKVLRIAEQKQKEVVR